MCYELNWAPALLQKNIGPGPNPVPHDVTFSGDKDLTDVIKMRSLGWP